MAEMKAKAEQQRCATLALSNPRHRLQQLSAEGANCRAAEDAREAERKQREGAAYLSPEQRAEAARAARQAASEGRAEGEEAQVLEKRFDPSRNYYELLGLPRYAVAGLVLTGVFVGDAGMRSWRADPLIQRAGSFKGIC
jgi:hypothetical protein